MIKVYDCVEIDLDKNVYNIKNGSIGTYSIDDIKTAKVLNEQASFKGKSKPFLHQYLGGTSFFAPVEPRLYVGIKIVTKNDDVLAIYVSKNPVIYNSDLFFNDTKLAKRIAKILCK